MSQNENEKGTNCSTRDLPQDLKKYFRINILKPILAAHCPLPTAGTAAQTQND